jgi:hypothetical protein
LSPWQKYHSKLLKAEESTTEKGQGGDVAAEVRGVGAVVKGSYAWLCGRMQKRRKKKTFEVVGTLQADG